MSRGEHDPLDELIRQHLDREAEQVDASAILAGVRRRLSESSRPRPASNPLGRVLRWSVGFVGIAAAVFFLIWGLPAGTASAEELVREAQQVHSGPLDRLYEIDSKYESKWTERFPLLAFQRKAELWTRGDRFTLQTSGDFHKWAWGVDEQGQLWIAATPKLGLIFDADETDDLNIVAMNFYSMQLESLLKELPRGFDLRREEIPDKPGFVRVIATPKAWLKNAKLREASLDLNLETKEVHRVQLKRLYRGETFTSVTYTLKNTARIPDNEYQLNGHTDTDAKILGPDKPLMRNNLWKRILEKRGMAPKELNR